MTQRHLLPPKGLPKHRWRLTKLCTWACGLVGLVFPRNHLLRIKLGKGPCESWHLHELANPFRIQEFLCLMSHPPGENTWTQRSWCCHSSKGKGNGGDYHLAKATEPSSCRWWLKLSCRMHLWAEAADFFKLGHNMTREEVWDRRLESWWVIWPY